MIQRLNLNSLVINNIVWDTNNIFINEITKEIQFIYLPLETVNRETNIIELMEQIIYASKPIEQNDSDFIMQFVYFVKSLGKFDAQIIENYISKVDISIVNLIKRHNKTPSGFMTDKQKQYLEHYSDDKDDEATDLMDDDSTDLLEGDEQTDLLIDSNYYGTRLLNDLDTQTIRASMCRTANKDTFSINKSVFRLGKEKSFSDYEVFGNDSVSRKHANIIFKNGNFFIVDLNSKNGTFVNGKSIPSQQEYEIHDGDNICLSNEEFIFMT